MKKLFVVLTLVMFILTACATDETATPEVLATVPPEFAGQTCAPP